MVNESNLNTFLVSPNRELDIKADARHVIAWLAYKAKESAKYKTEVSNFLTDNPYFREGEEIEGNPGSMLIDPDGTDLAKDFYNSLWIQRHPKIEFRQFDAHYNKPKSAEIIVQGDWMCSVWTTLKRGIVLSTRAKDYSNWWDRISNTDLRESANNDDHQPEDQAALLLLNIDDFKDVLLESAELSKFVREACTLANMVIVPNGFNVARSRTGYDYWDLSMLRFVQWEDARLFEDVDLAALMRRLINEDPNRLFLQDWLDESNYALLLPGHKTGPVLSPTYDVWKELVTAMTCRIQQRRQRIENYLGK